MEQVLKVKGMSCGHCKMAVEKSLKGLAGVETATVDLAAGTVKVVFEPGKVGTGEFEKAIDDAGYEVVK